MKTCNHEGCKYRQFGGGFCKGHQYLRPKKIPKGITDGTCKRPKRFSKFKSFVAGKTKLRHSDTTKHKDKKKQKAELRKRDRELWAEIWAERPHIDFETGEPIYGEPLTLYFHHILGKSDYPEYRYEKWNIVLVSWDTHAQAEAHCKLPKIDTYKNKLLKTKVR